MFVGVAISSPEAHQCHASLSELVSYVTIIRVSFLVRRVRSTLRATSYLAVLRINLVTNQVSHGQYGTADKVVQNPCHPTLGQG